MWDGKKRGERELRAKAKRNFMAWPWRTITTKHVRPAFTAVRRGPRLSRQLPTLIVALTSKLQSSPGHRLVYRLVLVDVQAHQCLDGFALVPHYHRECVLLAPATTPVFYQAAPQPCRTRTNRVWIKLKEELDQAYKVGDKFAVQRIALKQPRYTRSRA